MSISSTKIQKNVHDYTDTFNVSNITLGKFNSFDLLTDPRHFMFSLSRYKNAARLLPKECPSVLELGCGEGLGALMLAQYVQNVTAVDSDSISIQCCHQMNSKVTFIDDDFIGKNYGIFRSIVSLDVIEHIPVDLEPLFMETITQNLEPHGVCIIGTPNATSAAYASESSKIAHINLYEADRLYALMDAHFQNVLLLAMNDEVLHTGFLPMAHYLMAVGFGKK